MNLERFGQDFREMRERRGLTQEDVVERAAAYKDARSLRKIEGGEQRPKRDIVIILLVKGLNEHDAGLIDRFLELADYELLREPEVAQWRLNRAVIPRLEPEITFVPQERIVALSGSRVLAWRMASIFCVVAAFLLSALIRDPFLILTPILYAALYADSVLLESAHEFRGLETITAASLAFAVIWSSSLTALWIVISMAGPAGLWLAIAIFVFSALLQWVLVQPALPSYTVVPATFQCHTGRAAHLKNTGYFLLLVFSFWILPVHCLTKHGHALALDGAKSVVPLCPDPKWLWFLLVAFIAAAIPMGHFLLANVKAGPHFNRYVTLFYGRAILYFLLCIICLIWYSSWAA
jgi:transcriptional regulator with XRE-family HTH domain